MEMTGSIDSFNSSIHLTNVEETIVYPMKCWLNVCLSELWIPSRLLSKNNSSVSQQFNRGVFHTLERENSSQQIKGFSIYNDSDENEEIFESDSDTDIRFSSGVDSCDDIGHSSDDLPEKVSNSVSTLPAVSNITQKCNVAHVLYENLEKIKNIEPKNVSKDESLKDLLNGITAATCNGYDTGNTNSGSSGNASNSRISLNEILDTTPDINIKQFSFNYVKKDSIELPKKLDKQKGIKEKRTMKKERQLKKKAAKCIALDDASDLTQDQVYIDDPFHDDRLHAFYQHIMSQKNRSDNVQLKSTVEFPNLPSEEVKFIKSERSYESQPETSSNVKLQSVIDILSEPNNAEKALSENGTVKATILEDEKKNALGKLVIENIPKHVSEEDILSILRDYGEIKDFNMASDGKFLKVCVQMDLFYDIDWIVELLNGHDLLGAFSKTSLKCYNATETCR